MSNTSEVTPYETQSTSVESSVDNAAMRWLEEEARAAVESLRSDRKHQRLEHRVTALNMREAEPLLISARKLGYRVESLQATSPTYLLRGAGGERLAVTTGDNGRLRIQTLGEQTPVQSLLHRATLDRSVQHFRKLGMQVQETTLPNGEVQLQAREMVPLGPGGSAHVTTRVRRDGSVHLDVNGLNGSRCEEIVNRFAEALGGSVTDTNLKHSYYHVPAETPKVRL
jgi:hypothetical protein